MIKKKDEITKTYSMSDKGSLSMTFHNLADFEGRNEKVKMFSLVKLNPGEEVGYHEHYGEFESYYILTGKGLYNDNGKEVLVEAGTVTFTPSGEGHGLKNTGDEVLDFIALIVKD